MVVPPRFAAKIWGYNIIGSVARLHRASSGSSPDSSTNLWNDGIDQSSQNISEVGRLIEPNRSCIFELRNRVVATCQFHKLEPEVRFLFLLPIFMKKCICKTDVITNKSKSHNLEIGKEYLVQHRYATLIAIEGFSAVCRDRWHNVFECNLDCVEEKNGGTISTVRTAKSDGVTKPSVQK